MTKSATKPVPKKNLAKKQVPSANTRVQSLKPAQERRFFVPLKNLKPDPKQVRRYQSEAGISELVALIQSQGLLQNLTVRPSEKSGVYYVSAGNRRLRALKEMAKNKCVTGPEKIPVTDNYSVPVLEIMASQSPTEVSLAENVGRENMHVADQVEAFRRLNEDEGLTPEQIGDRFGLSHMTVRRRVKLAKVSPRLIDVFKAGEIGLQELEALALSDDHAAQEQVFDSLHDYNLTADAIRARLTCEKIPTTSRFVRFICLDAYTAAGGTITRDLFSDDQNTYLNDKPIVMRLVDEKLQLLADEIQRAEGWKWVECGISRYDWKDSLPIIEHDIRDLSEAEENEYAVLKGFIDDHQEAYFDNTLTREDTDLFQAKIARLEEIKQACVTYDEATKPYAGARVYLAQGGCLGVVRGMLKLADQRELNAQKQAQRYEAMEIVCETEPTADAATPEIPEPEPEPEYSAPHIFNLTGIRTAALAYEVSQRPDVALALAVHTLGLKLFYGPLHYYHVDSRPSCVRISTHIEPNSITSVDDDNATAFTAVHEVRERLVSLIPKDKEQFFAWCLSAERLTLLDMLAFCIGLQIDAQLSHITPNNVHSPDMIAHAVGLNMSLWWQPSKAFLSRITKTQIAEAVTDAGAPPELANAIVKATKDEAIKLALEFFKDKHWLPDALRNNTAPPVYIDNEATQAAAQAIDPDAPCFAGLPANITRPATAL